MHSQNSHRSEIVQYKDSESFDISLFHESGTRSLVIADAGVEHLELLLDGMGREFDLLVVEPGMELADVFAQAFSGAYATVHFLGHGAPGAITLAGRLVHADEFIASASDGKSNLGSLHFWSCATGSGSEGKLFVDRIGEAFGVGVTAFSGLVGAESLGGSWMPDLAYGEVTSVSSPFANAAAYPGTLTTSPLLSFEVVSTTGGQDIKILLAAGQSIQTADIAMTYNTAQATYVSSVLYSSNSWNFLANESVPGQILFSGTSMTAIPAGASPVLLATVSFTFKTGGSAVQPSLVSGTDLTLNDLSLNLGTLPELVPPTISAFTSTSTNGGYFTSSTVNITATASEALQAGAQITVTLNSGTGRTVTLTRDATDATKLTGTYTVQSTDYSADLDIASYTLGTGTAAPKDVAGNAMTSTTVPTGSNSLAGAKAIVINPLAPTTTLSALLLSADTGDASDFITSTAAQTITATLSTALVSGETLWGSVDNGTTWTNITSKASGTAVSWNAATLSGSSTIKLQVRDSNSNAGPTASQAYVVDTTAPTISSFTSTKADGYYKVGEQINVTATASEALQAGAQVTVTLNTGKTALLTRDNTDATKLVGTYTVQTGDTSSDLTVSSYTLGTGTAAPKDVAGNSMTSTTVPSGHNIGDASAIVIDTTAPTKTLSGIHISADTGTSTTDFLTKTAAQTITATLSAALASGTEKLYGSVDNGTTWTDITSKVSGTAVSWDGVTLAGSSSILLQVRDLAGNAGTTAGQTYVLDTTAPTTTVPVVDITNDTGSSATDFITNTATQSVTGALSAALAPGERLKGSPDGGVTWYDITSNVSDTTFTVPNVTLESGSNLLKVKVVDAAGNDGPVTSHAYTLDTIAPAIDTSVALPVFSLGNVTVTFTENVELGAGTITLHHGGDNAVVAINTPTVSGHTVIIDPVDTLTAGDTYYVTFSPASVKDVAGNLGATATYSFVPSASFLFSSDTGLGSQIAHTAINDTKSAKLYETDTTDTHPFDRVDIVSTKQGDTYTDSYKVTWTDATHWQAYDAYGSTTLHAPQLLLGEVSGSQKTMSTLGVVIEGKANVYSTISDALAAAQDGDTIIVGSGKYTENVTIDKAVKLIGANHDASAVKLDASGNPIPDLNDNVRSNSESWIDGTVTVISSNVEINGFRLHNIDGPLKFVENSKGLDNLTLVDNFITGYYAGSGPSLGVQGETGTNATGWNISNNFIGGVVTDPTHYGSGSLYLSGLADSSISGNAFWRPGAAHLYLSSLTNVTVADNNFYHGVHAAGANFDNYANDFWGGDGYSGGTGYGYGYGYGYGGDGGAYFGRNYWLELKGVNDGVYITGNTGSYNSGGIQLYGQTAGYSFDDVVIADNTFKDFINADPFGTLTDAQSRHLSGLMGAVNISVSSGATASDLLIKGNTVTLGADQVYSHYDVSSAVQVTGYVSDLVVQDNTVNWKSSEGINFTAGQTYVGSAVPTSSYITTPGTTIEGVGLYGGLGNVAGTGNVVDVAGNNISFQNTIAATGAGIYIDKQLTDTAYGTYSATTTITGDNTVTGGSNDVAIVLDNFGTSNTVLPTGITVKKVSGSAALAVYNADSGSFVSYTPTTQSDETPFVLNETENQSAEAGTAFSFTLPAGTFVDIFPANDTLSYTATLANGSALPSWLSFNTRTLTFSGTPAAGDTGSISVKVTAIDNASASATDTFAIIVHETNVAPTSTNDSIIIGASGTYRISVNDFGVFNDPNAGDQLEKVKLTITGTSHVEYSIDGVTWAPLTTGLVLSREQIDAHPYVRLASGYNEDTFKFQVGDGKLYSTASYDLKVYKESLLFGTSTTVTNGGADLSTTVSDGGTQFINTFFVPTGVAVTSKEAGANFTVTDLMKLYLDQAGQIDSTTQQSALQALAAHVTNTDHFRYLKFDPAAGYNANTPIGIVGDAGTHTVLVIDLSAFAGQAMPHIQLDNVDFAIIIGAGNFDGGAGSNIAVADDAAQQIVLGPEDDTLYGGGGDDTIGSLGGNDVLYGDAGNDSVTGGDGNDTLYGGTGNDTLHGDAGDDVLYGNAGNNLLDGGAGTDKVIFDTASTHYTAAHVSFVVATDTWTVTSDTGQVDTLVRVESAEFSDGNKIDTAAPTVASYNPTLGASNVAVGANIEITFSELIKMGAGNIEIHAGSATGALVERFDAATSARLAVAGAKLTIDPTANLSSGTDYYVTFDAGTVKDYLDFSNSASSSYHFQTVAQAAAATASNPDSGSDTGAIVVGGVVAVGLIYWLLY